MKSATSSNDRLPLLFLTKDQTPVTFEGKVRIVLTPAYYYFSAQQLPVKRLSKAKELAPSVFDGSIPEGVYSYKAIKHGDLYWLFAYDDALIAQKLQQLGVKPAQIEGIYLAQVECFDLDAPLRIDKHHALIQSEGVVSLAPIAYVADVKEIDDYCMHKGAFKERLSLNFFQNSLLQERHIYALMALSVLFIALNLIHYLLLHRAHIAQSVQEYRLSERYQLPATSFEIRGLKSALQKKSDHQMQLRRALKLLLDIPLEKGEYFTKLTFKSKGTHLEIHLNDPKRAEAIKRYLLKNKVRINKAKVIDNLLLLGVKYE